MPTYEYACPNCGIVEAFQSIKEDALTKCPTCKKAKVQRIISGGSGVIFKGSGFWETDYNRSSDYKSKAGKDSSDNKGSDNKESTPAATSGDDKKSDKKPEKSKPVEPPQPQAQPKPQALKPKN